MPQKIPFVRQWTWHLWGVLWILNKNSTGVELPLWRHFCNLTRTVDWTWPWKIKALHMRCVGLLAPRGQGRQREFPVIPGVGFCCVGGVTVCCCSTAVTRCKSKGQCYLPTKYHRRWTAYRM